MRFWIYESASKNPYILDTHGMPPELISALARAHEIAGIKPAAMCNSPKLSAQLSLFIRSSAAKKEPIVHLHKGCPVCCWSYTQSLVMFCAVNNQMCGNLEYNDGNRCCPNYRYSPSKEVQLCVNNG